MPIMASHAFARRQLNALDENGNEGCAVCGRTRSVHPRRVAETLEEENDGE